MDDEPVVWRGHDALRPYLVRLEDLAPDEGNARKHPQKNLDAIAQSLGRFGQTFPILHRTGIIVSGHGRAQAAQALGWTHLAALSVDSMSTEEARALALADNKSAELAEWDEDVLKQLLGSLPDELRGLVGFEDLPEEPAPKENEKPQMKGVSLTAEQFTVVMQAVAKLRSGEGDESISVGRALELIAADWLS